MAPEASPDRGETRGPFAGSLPLKPSLIGLDKAALHAVLESLGEQAARKRMRASQIDHWLYHRGAASFEAMTTLPADLRAHLEQGYSVDRPKIVDEQRSVDGTGKWLLRFDDGQDVEMVHIPNVQQGGPEVERGALCVSSQVGCSLACTFCHTGTMPLVRNLRAGDILAQILVARDRLDEWPTPKGQRRISHIVMMGMGEPLLNYENVKKALLIAMDADGLAFSKRKITLSTSGIVPKIEQCGRELGVNLAISLHAVRDDVRDVLVPINRKWNIATLMEACRAYPSGDRWVTFEYVMLDGVNDSDAEAKDLVRLLKGLPAKVNLIPFNPWPDAGYRCSSPERIEAFARIVRARRLSLAGAHAARPGYSSRLRPAENCERTPAKTRIGNGLMKRLLVRNLATIGFFTLLLTIGLGVLVWMFLPEDEGLPERVVLTLDLRHGFYEAKRSASLTSFDLEPDLTLADTILALERAGERDEVAGLVARISGGGPGFAQAQELREAIRRFRSQGKFAFAFSTSFGEFGPGTLGYYLASVFDEIHLQPLGAVGLTGLSLETPLLKGFFDQVGVTPSGGKRGPYKTAANMFTEDRLTREHRESLEWLADSLFEQIKDGIATDRGFDAEAVEGLIDGGPYGADEAFRVGLVDRLSYWDEVVMRAEKRAGSSIDLIDLERFAGLVPPDDEAEEVIALIEGVGQIPGGGQWRRPGRLGHGGGQHCPRDR